MPTGDAQPLRRLAMHAAISFVMFAALHVTAHVPAAEQVDFVRDVKPIFMRHCSACHGPLKQEAGLRLDAAQLINKGSENGPVLVAGKADESLLIEAVTGSAGFRMPPEEEGTPLSQDQIAVLKSWINGGAKGPPDETIVEDPLKHWSYQPIVRPHVPRVKNDEWVRSPIDAFIAAKHEQFGLNPNPPAAKSTWLRRVYLDLVGLPPTAQELHAFLADESAEAYERVVDRLLDSPRYGERWGRHWMDVWRYSDWYGRRGQNEIRYSQYHIWRWRDWIIESLNEDKGYDRMILEMLAGDELAPDDSDTLRATGFLGRNWYKFDRNVWLDQTVEHTSMGLLAMTLKCARCHDHKYDPISQQDYYRFRAFFEPHEFRIDPVGNEPDTAKDGLARVFDAKLDTPTYLFIRGDDRNPDKESPLTPAVPSSLGATELDIQQVELPLHAYAAIPKLIADAQKVVSDADAALVKAKDNTEAARKQLDQLIAAVRKSDGESADAAADTTFLADDFSQARPDTWKTIRGKWEHRDGRLLQTEVTNFASLVSLRDHPQDFKAKVRYITTAGGTYRSVGLFFDMVEERDAQAVYTSANDNRPSVQAFHRKDGGEVYPPDGIVQCDVKVGQEVTLEIEVRGSQLKILVDGQQKLDYQMPMPRQAGRFALWCHSGTVEFLDVELRPLMPNRSDVELAYKQAVDAEQLAENAKAIADSDHAALQLRIEAERAKATPAPNQDEAARRAAKAERQTAVLKAEAKALEAEQALARAQQLTNSDEPNKAIAEANKQLNAARELLDAARAALETESTNYTPIPATYPKASTGRRLALAQWMINRQNPRTARVAVNHIWLRHFGAAIVPSVANFGLSGQPPSHPELLDWLAAELTNNDWRMKHLHRQIVLSSTYRMSSQMTEPVASPSYEADPENRYLWRMNFRRMEAEVVRDSLLHLAGQLDTTMGGPELADDLGQTSRRRSLYFRTTPDNKMELLELFDLANPNECYERQESVVPQQSLAMMNSAIALTQSRLVAGRMTAELEKQGIEPTSAAFVTLAFEHLLSRLPSADELSRCQRFLAEHAEIFAQPNKLSAYPPSAGEVQPPSSDPQQRARENLVHVLFNHNEFVTIR